MRKTVSGALHLEGDQFLLLPGGRVLTITGSEERRQRVEDAYTQLALDLSRQVHADPVGQAGEAVAEQLRGRFVPGEMEGELDPTTDEDGRAVIY